MTIQKLQQLTVSKFIECNIAHDKELLNILERAATLTGAPLGGINILDEHNLYLKVGMGYPVCSVPRAVSFCNHTVNQGKMMIVTDVLNDERFANLPSVTGEPGIRFYAGAPLIKSDGQTVGTLFLNDTKKNYLDEQQQLIFKMLADQVIRIMELRANVQLLETKHAELEKQLQINHHANSRLRSVFENSVNFKVLLNKKGEVIDYNKTAFKFISRVHNLKIKRGERFTKYLEPGFLETFNDKFNLSLKGKKASAEGSSICKKSKAIWWEASFEASRGINSEITGVLFVMRDVTERKLKEQKIILQNQSLLEIAHIQAHEFRGPLTTIMGLIELMHEEHPHTPSEYLPLLKNAVASLDNNINQVINHIEVVVNQEHEFAI